MYDELGVADGYHDVAGSWRATPTATIAHVRRLLSDAPPAGPMWFVGEGQRHDLLGPCRLLLEDGSDLGEVTALDARLPCGYHDLVPVDGGPTTRLVIAPARCPTPERSWGVAAQVYSLWRSPDWGIGDLRDVARLGRCVASRGGRAVLLSPLHAHAPTLPQEPSPYYPSSRRWLDPLLIPLDGVPPSDLAIDARIDRDRVWTAKRHELAALFDQQRTDGAWRAWAHAQGRPLWRFAAWGALAELHGPRWRRWPAELQHPDSPTVADLFHTDERLAREHDFHAWMQWLAARELRTTVDTAGVDLIADLAVGCSPDGADAWIHQDLMTFEASIGAPPDPFNEGGQDWGLPPFVPASLRAARYEPFIDMVRAACAGMGGIRIDHVMGLFRQFWVPAGGAPSDGVYVRMPADELLAIVRLEAARAGTFVVGEDLGTVEPEVHEAMRSGGMLGTKVWWFDPDTANWPSASLATVTTHDLPTLAGVRSGVDGSPEMHDHLQALEGHSGLGALAAVHAEIAASPALVTIASLDDIAAATERPNRPGTTDASNWTHRTRIDLDDLFDSPDAGAVVAAFDGARPRRSRR